MDGVPSSSTFTILGNPFVEAGFLPPYNEIRYGGTCSELKRDSNEIIYSYYDNNYSVITSDNNSCPVGYYYDD